MAFSSDLPQRKLAGQIPLEFLPGEGPEMILRYLRSSPAEAQRIVQTMLPSLEEADESEEVSKDRFLKAVEWAMWPLCGGEPKSVLAALSQAAESKGGVCGTVWGANDIAYRCKTCEHDPTCAICVPCFLASNHENHDFAMIRTGGGCCDCGDPTAWKETGFCRHHQGPGHAAPLPAAFVEHAQPVLDALLIEWVSRLHLAIGARPNGTHQKWAKQSREERSASQATFAIAGALLRLCNASEALLHLVAARSRSPSLDLLDSLMRAEGLLPTAAMEAEHALLYKLLGDPEFKYKFALVLIKHYPMLLQKPSQSSIMNGFSVQVFTVPVLTPRLVEEAHLLDMLLTTLRQTLNKATVGRLLDVKMLVRHGGRPTEDLNFHRVTDDLRYVLSHFDAAQYATLHRPDLMWHWLQLLAVVQGMGPMKRELGLHVEHENGVWLGAYFLESQLAAIHPLLLRGASGLDSSSSSLGVEKEVNAELPGGKEGAPDQLQAGQKGMAPEGSIGVPDALLQLTRSCALVLASWLASPLLGNVLQVHPLGKEDAALTLGGTDILSLDPSEPEGLELWSAMLKGLGAVSHGWPTVPFDVATQEVSFHIPLHRMLAQLLNGCLRLHLRSSFAQDRAFLQQVLPLELHGEAFASALLEHPLRVQVLCAQVQAGMWRRNGHTMVQLCELYHSVHWCENSLELDIFLMQCSAALAPANAFVERVQERYGLAGYFLPAATAAQEYEGAMAGAFLECLIRIAAERAFCGMPAPGALRRELVQRLAIGDATHSQLLKVLPPRLADSAHLSAVLPQVASFSTPSGMEQGKYTLRAECWIELDMHHPRWHQRELQQAEDRYQRITGASPFVRQLPRWQAPWAPLSGLLEVVTCRRTAEILRGILYHALLDVPYTWPRAPDAVLRPALHLLALSLDACAARVSQNHGKGAPPAILSIACQKGPGDHSLLSLLVELAHKWEGVKAQAHTKDTNAGGGPLSAATRSAPEAGEGGRHELAAVVLHLLRCFYSLDNKCRTQLQRTAPHIFPNPTLAGGLVSSSQSPTGDHGAETNAAQMKKMAARHRQAALMAKMKAAQHKFEEAAKGDSEDAETQRADKAADAGPVHGLECALCHESDASGSPLCYITFVQRSRLLAIADLGTHRWRSKGLAAIDAVLQSPQQQARVEPSYNAVLASSQLQGTGDAASRAAHAPGDFGGGPAEEDEMEVREEEANPEAEAQLLEWMEAIQDVEDLGQEGWPEAGDRRLLTLLQQGRPLDQAALVEVRAAMERDGEEEEEDDEEFHDDQGHGPASSSDGIEDEMMEDMADTETPDSSQDWVLADNDSSDGELHEAPHETPGRIDVARGTEAGEHPLAAQRGESAPRTFLEAASDNKASKAVQELLVQYVAEVKRVRPRRQLHYARLNETSSFLGYLALGRRQPSQSEPGAALESIGAGTHVGACGHGIHQACFERYFQSLLYRHNARVLYEGSNIVNPKVGEYLCPVCRRLANSILPAFPPAERPLPAGSAPKPPAELSLVSGLAVIGRARTEAGRASAQPRNVSGPELEVIEGFAGRICQVEHPDWEQSAAILEGGEQVGLRLWDALAYSLAAAELVARGPPDGASGSGHKSHQAPCLASLHERQERLVAAMDLQRRSTLLALLPAALAAQDASHLEQLLHALALQLLTASLVEGSSCNELPPVADGTPLEACTYVELHSSGSDVQLWKAAADPVLASDPFLHLMRLLLLLGPTRLSASDVRSLLHIYHLLAAVKAAASMASEFKGKLLVVPKAVLPLLEARDTTACATSAAEERSSGSGSMALEADWDGLFWSATRRLTLPFLRRSVLMQHLLFGDVGALGDCVVGDASSGSELAGWLPLEGRPHPPSAREWTVADEEAPRDHLWLGSATSDQAAALELEEAELWEKQLGLAPLQQLLNSDVAAELASLWVRHLERERASLRVCNVVPPALASPLSLMPLPHRYHDLFQRYVKEKCHHCETVPKQPLLCLLCGAFCCQLTSSFDRQRTKGGQCGQAGHHAKACGAGIGVFLILRLTTVLLLRHDRYALWPSPYLDVHGEEDENLRRGKPLYLCLERYAALTALVVTHGLDHSSLVLSRTARHNFSL